MPILTKEVEVKVHPNTVEYYTNLGYEIPIKKASKTYCKTSGKEFVYDFSKTIMVKVTDLPPYSGAEIEILCDMCEANKITLPYSRYTRVVRETGSYVCTDCSLEKRVQTCQKKYGVSFPAQLEEVKEKIKQTSLEKYGTEHYSQTKECHEKMKQTCLELYGVEHASQSPKIRAKTNETLCKNGTQKTSKQQLYLHSLYGGELNYPVSYYATDICFLKEKTVIEYDGGGHNLRVILGKLTQEEFKQKEIIRSKTIKSQGYKTVRIISTKDLLPSDTTLLQMLSMAREYFNTTSHTWINFDIDNSKMINAENKDIGGVFFDYGQLRKIKEIA